MPDWRYKGRDKFSKLVNGAISGEDESTVAAKLTKLGITPISITEIKQPGPAVKFFSPAFRIKPSDLNIFTRELATLQNAGLPLLLSLTALRQQAQDKFFGEVITRLISDIESGASLSAALAKYPAVFNPIYINMVATGELSGELGKVLERLAVLNEHDQAIRLRIKSATRYPMVVTAALIIGFILLTTLVIPRYARIYQQHTTALPLPTQALLIINYAVTKLWWLLIIAYSGGYFLFRKYTATKNGRLSWDSLKLKIPVFGPLLLKLSVSRFTRIAGMLMHSGIPILKIMDISADSTGNQVLTNAIINIKDDVVQGRGMSESMKASGLFPPIVTQMVAVGEDTGKLDDLLIHVSNYYDEQVNFTIINLTSLIEPFLIFVLGLGVLLMALGIFLPMWNLMSIFKK